MSYASHEMLLYIQTSLYNGKQPDENSFYCFSAHELAENTGKSTATVRRNIDEVIDYLSKWCDFETWAKFNGYKGEILYQDVSYEKGVLKFRRNPLTYKSEFSFLWALPPLSYFFAYDFFDEKHRRRTNGYQMEYDAIPWSWDADQYEKELAKARAAIQAHWSAGSFEANSD